MSGQRAVIYIRVSTLDQAREGYSLAAQQKALEEMASSRGHEIVGVYEDAGISGKDIAHRPAMRELLEDAQRGCFDLVLVWALSRLTRSVADLYATLEVFQARRIGLVSYTEGFDTSTPTGRAMLGLLGVFAQMEREITSERVQAAMAERAAQGKRTTNEVLGYDLDGKDGLTINNQEAEQVQYIFDRFLAYHNLSVVAELCSLRGYTGKRGRPLKAQHIKVILTRPIYAGYNTFKGQLFQGNHPSIVTVRQFNAVQKLLKRDARLPVDGTTRP